MNPIVATDDEFISAFEECRLTGESFRHADHVRMGYLYLRRYPAVEALQRFSSALLNFAAAKGKPGLYNETITWAFLLLIRERMARSAGNQTWAEFAAPNPDLLTWKDSVLKKYYREETLSSSLAKQVFLFPDKLTP